MSLVLISILSLIALACFFYCIGKRSHWSLSSLKIPFLVIVVLGTGLFMYGYYPGSCEKTNIISLFIRSFISSLEMFVSETHLDEIVLENETGFLETKEGRIYLTLFFIIYPAALIISFITIASLISQGLEGRLWMCRHRSFQNPQYIFWGLNSHSIAIANNLIAGGGTNGARVNPNDIIFIELPDKMIIERNTLSSFLRCFVASDCELSYAIKKTSGKRPPILLAKRMIHTSNASNLKELLSFTGLDGLYSRFNTRETEVFLLDDDENLNLQTLNTFLIAGCTAPTFYCHAGKEGLVGHFDDAITSNRVHFVDSAYLVVRDLMLSENGTFHPARFVEIATDENGNRLGYINGHFNAAIIGFGRVGQDALRFLYEFGSFPNKDGNLADSKFHIFDSRMNEIQHLFMEKYPGASYETENAPGRIVFHPTSSDSQEFHSFLHKCIDSLNYFVVATGDDDNNLSISLDILDFAFRYRANGLKNFIVLTRITHTFPKKALEQELINNYKKLPGGGMNLGIFGQDEKVWKYDIISDKWINQKARLYFEAYQEASGEDIYDAEGNHCWDVRANLSKQGDDVWKNKRKLEIQEEQDRHNCFHSATKRILGNDKLYGKQQYILPKYSEKTGHYANPKASDDSLLEATFEYLAIGEHLRWVSSYEMNGYSAPPEGKERDYLKKWHEYLKPYSELPENIKHYDWIPVKIAFAMKK